MKKILHTIYTRLLLVGLVAFTLTSCMDDELVKSGEVVEGVPITVTLNLGGLPASDVTVSTKASGNDLSGLSNLTIYVYDSQGNFQHKVSNYKGEKSLTVGKSSGTTDVIYPVTFNTTSGTKKLLAVGNRGGGFWKASGDVDASTMTFDEFKSYLLDLNYIEQNGEATPLQIVSDEQMLMSGWNEGIIFDASGYVTGWGDLTGTDRVAVQMKRAMAHVTFKIPSGSTTKKVEENEHTVTFTPTSYSVYNVPVKTMLANMKSEITPVNEETNKDVVTFKNFSATNIAAAEGDSYSFSFYMPENIYDNIKKADGSELVYNDREAWEGQSLSATQKEWKYAPKTSTFVVISGSYVEVDANNNTVYTGNVQYTIHLGDFGESNDPNRDFGDFSIERNCSYTYNVSVKGVDKIIVEAKKEGGEYQNGAEGQIYSYKGTAYTYNLDAHYEQVYLEYNLSSIAEAANVAVTASQNTDAPLPVDDAIAYNLILVIQSEAMDYNADEEPYYITRNKRGTLRPYKIYIDKQNNVEGSLTKDEVLMGDGTGITPTKGFDYKWVELWPQKGDTLAPYPGVSEWSRETGITDDVYGGTETAESSLLIDVYDAIVAMGKAVKLIYENTYENGTHNITTEVINEDGIWITKVGDDYKARFTAFINEYYYYKHPLTGAGITAWSVFVNKMPREMIIAMSSDVSIDGNSSYSQAYSYISQLSMQTPYSDRNDVVMAAFGLETYNETPIDWNSAPLVFSDRNVDDDDLTSDNGRSNQLLWLDAGSSDTKKRKWVTYINQSMNGYTSSNTTTHASHKLNAYNRKHYDNACMSRNRDLNGNDTIDDNEVRWYLASVNEYLRMGLAAQAISSNARLYQGDKSQMTYSGYPSDYIGYGALYYSSSKSNERVYWAVEKGAWGNVGTDKVPNTQGMPIRCVRVLPAVSAGTEGNITKLDVKAESFFKSYSVNGNTVLEFKNRMISDMYRVRTDDPLNEHDEDDPANRFSEGIIIAQNNIKDGSNDASYNAPKINGITYVSWWDGFTTNAIKEDPCTDYHEDGDGGVKWRVPNLNELVMMRRALTVGNLNSLCCTQFSNSNVRLGFVATSNVNCEVAGYNTNYKYWNWFASHGVRCVRDVPDGYMFPKN
ncbi:MAG TPA: hypothetical protein K8W07_05805 [Bacteroides togonis]|nr:hypothetical protein [Bacteroides togonis]